GGGAGQARTPSFGPTGTTGGTPFGPTGSQGDAARRTTPVGPGAAAGTPAGGQGDEDQEHRTKYLIPTDEYFDDKRMVAPETIGG
ncbi:MAG: hypothetical protein HOQ46_15530, partial [Saccharothrix sp.]|nr:hypothetical protein [Saccharothrix sp.]